MSTNRLRPLVAAAIMAGGLAAGAPAAEAAGVTQVVSGTVPSTLGVSLPTPAAFSGGLTSGGTATSSGGSLTLISTSPGWTLSVKDAGAGAGKMRAAASGCSSSAPELSNPVSVTVAPAIAIGSVTSAGPVAMSGSDQTVASGSGILGVTIFNTAYTQVVSASDALQAGCVYSITSTYTLQ